MDIGAPEKRIPPIPRAKGRFSVRDSDLQPERLGVQTTDAREGFSEQESKDLVLLELLRYHAEFKQFHKELENNLNKLKLINC